MRIPHFLALAYFLIELSSSAAKKPNIVYIMCDELGYYETSFMGSKTIKTPRIDRLAAEGVFEAYIGLPDHAKAHPGQRAVVRFTLDKRPLLEQWRRRLLQTLAGR